MLSLKKTLVRTTEKVLRFEVAGIDISDRTLKYLKFSRGKNGIAFDVFGEITIPKGVIENGEIKNEDEMKKVLHAWLASDGRSLRGSFANVSLPEEKSFVRLIQLPKIKRDAIINAVRWEIEANIPLPVDELVFDYEVIEAEDTHLDHLDLVLTAFPKVIVDSYLRVLKGVGLQPMALELESQAIARSVLGITPDLTSRIVVDMGRSRTSFIIMTGGAIIFTTTIELGGYTLEENIMKEFEVSQERAAAMKKNYGLNKEAEGGRFFNSLIPSLSALSEELRRAIAYYESHSDHVHAPTHEMAEILLVGGESNLFGLDTFLASSLKVPVRLADPFAAVHRDLELAIPPIPKNEALAFTTAIGLAVRGL